MIPQVNAVSTYTNGAFPYGHSFCRLRATDLNGAKLYIDARTKKECHAQKTALAKIARRHNIPMLKIHNLLHALALSQIDTAPVDLEEEQFAFNAIPGWLGEVPDPDDNVDVLKARMACLRDAELCERVLQRGASVHELLLISNNQRAWMEYFVVRHADPRVRSQIANALAEHAALRAIAGEKAQRQLERKRKLNGQQAN